MFRIVCNPSLGSTELCLTEITLNDSQIFFVCLVGVWQRNFEPAVCVHGTTGWELVLIFCGVWIRDKKHADTSKVCNCLQVSGQQEAQGTSSYKPQQARSSFRSWRLEREENTT